jgi:hypothetical protein
LLPLRCPALGLLVGRRPVVLVFVLVPFRLARHLDLGVGGDAAASSCSSTEESAGTVSTGRRAACGRRRLVLSSSRSSTTTVMWQVRWKYWCALPRLTGRIRFIVGPSSIMTVFSHSSSRDSSKLCSALAAADRIVLATSCAACWGAN